MHGAIRNRLEDLLQHGRVTAGQEVNNHLASCGECSAELGVMESQSKLLGLLRSPELIDPAPGFYARVLQRIDEQASRVSAWAALACSPVLSRIAYVTLTLALVLGGYVITSEARDGDLTGRPTMLAHVDAPVTGDAVQQRQAVLENFATH